MTQPNSIWKQIFTTQMLSCVGTGFASGLPLYLLLQMIPTWMRDHQVDLKTIGLFSLTSLPYVWKFLWHHYLTYHPHSRTAKTQGVGNHHTDHLDSVYAGLNALKSHRTH